MLRNYILLIAFFLSQSSPWIVQTSGTTAQFRGVSAVDARVAWASGTKGTVVRTIDGGKTWQVIAVPGASELDFRDIEAIDASTAWVLSIGTLTALIAALMALVVRDVKRILAFSTISQLGYMMAAVGAAGTIAAIYHLTTHAFFKAMLFLAAGSLIHAVHTNDIRDMGVAMIFDILLDSPEEGDITAEIPTPVEGEVCHGREIAAAQTFSETAHRA